MDPTNLLGAGGFEDLQWDPQNILAFGSNKLVFGGTFRGQDVVVCQPRRDVQVDIHRATNEIRVLRALGPNPAIVELIASEERDRKPILVLEMVQPIGFNLDRLWSQYALIGFKVPERLCGRLFRQIVRGLQHMHSRSILHLDLKTANVLVTATYNAKLCDFGMSDSIGTIKVMQCQNDEMQYMPPEMLQGKDPLDTATDCWGLGLILHQIYNHGEYRLVRYSKKHRKWNVRKDAPVVARMPELTQEVIKGLILDDPTERLTLDGMLESEWLSRSAADFETPQEDEAQWLVIPHTSPEPSKWLAPYLGGSRPLTISSFIGSHQVHLFNRKLADLDFHALTTVLLVRQPGTEDTFVNPTEDIMLTEFMHVYLGIPADSQDTDAAVEAAEELFAPMAVTRSPSRNTVRSTNSIVVKYDLHDVTTAYTPSNKREVCEAGAMYSFAMEFDSFRFPQHIGHEATIGKESLLGPRREFNDVGHIALDLKDTFNINLVGIQRVGEDSAEWFPDPISLVRPGDLGIVARCPMTDGSSKPLVKEETLARLMIEERFVDVILARRDCVHAPVEVGIARKVNYDSVRVYKKPVEDAAHIGDISNGTEVRIRDRYGDFLLVEAGAVSGWVGVKNVHADSTS